MAEKQQVLVADTTLHAKTNVISPFWFLLHFLLVALTLGIGVFFYGIMPAVVPTHYNAVGNADAWLSKTLNWFIIETSYPVVRVARDAVWVFHDPAY